MIPAQKDSKITQSGFDPSLFKSLLKAEESLFWFSARNQLLVWTFKRFAKKCRSFFEVGCGTGYVLEAFAKTYPKADVFGCDIFAEGLTTAAARAPRAVILNGEFSPQLIPLRVDAIGAFDVLEHIKDDTHTLRLFSDALNPMGLVFITVPQHRFLWSAPDRIAHHCRRYSRGELEAKLETTGFTPVFSTSFVTLLLPFMLVSRFAQQRNQSGRDLLEFHINPIVNHLFSWVMTTERLLIRLGLKFPVGGSRLIVAQKQRTAQEPT